MNNGFEDLDGQFTFFGLNALDKLFWTNSAGFGTEGTGKRGQHRWGAPALHMGIPAAVSFLRRIVIRHTKDQKYESTRLTLLQLPPKHVETLLVPFKTPAEEEVYRKLEMYFAAQYDEIKSSGEIRNSLLATP